MLEIGKNRDGKANLPLLLEMDQFQRIAGEVRCFRPSCEGCAYAPTCDYEETTRDVGPGVNTRRAIQATPGWRIVAIDYKGIELRIVAQLTGEPFWIQAFQEDRDLHMETAIRLFGTETPTQKQRSDAKTINFALLYLARHSRLMEALGLDEPDAYKFWKMWRDNVPEWEAWTEKTKKFVDRFGYVPTWFGRRRDYRGHLDEIDSKPKNSKERFRLHNRLYRMAVNSAVQGTCADLIKMVMIDVSKWIAQEKLQDKVKLLMSVHDEIVYEVKYEDQESFEDLCRAIGKRMIPDLASMGNPTGGFYPDWTVPVGVDIEYGKNWAEIQKIKEKKQEKEMKTPSPDRRIFQIRIDGQMETNEKIYLKTDLKDALHPEDSGIMNAKRESIELISCGKKIELENYGDQKFYIPFLEDPSRVMYKIRNFSAGWIQK